MSPEKRLLPFLEAVAESGVRADVEVIGGGGQLRAARLAGLGRFGGTRGCQGSSAHGDGLRQKRTSVAH
jgi:hypothetical protein